MLKINILLICILYSFIIFNVNIHFKNLKRIELFENEKRIEYLNTLKMYTQHINNLKKYAVKENPPEYIKLHELLKDFQQTQSWDNLIAMGDIYKTGAYPRFKNNKDLAMECYKIAARCPDGDVAGIAQLKYIETSRNNINDIDNVGEELPSQFCIEMCKLALNTINNTHYSLFNRPKSKKQTNDNAFNNRNDNVFNNNNPIILTPHLDTHVYKNDSQNVHDHSVSNILKSNIQKLNKNKLSKNDDKIPVIIDSILTHPELPESVKANSLIVIDNLNSTENHGSYGITEKDALLMIWDKINKYDNQKKNNSIEILARQLDSGVEHGNIVCSTGKIARIIGTLDGIDEEITPSKPLWIIRDEIGNLAGKIMNSNVSNKKQEFESTVNDVYIKELNMNKSIIQPIIDEYSEHL